MIRIQQIQFPSRLCILLLSAAILVSCSADPTAKKDAVAPPGEGTGSIRFSEHLIMDGYAYPYGIFPADLDNDGDLDLTSADYRPANSLYWFENDGSGNFTRHFIQKDDPERLERNAVGDIDQDGHLDVAIVKNLYGHLIWFQNPGNPQNTTDLWKRHVITTRLAGAYEVALSDLDADGDLDVAASSWRMGNQFAWFENPATPCKGTSGRLCFDEAQEWPKHLVDANLAETRCIKIADVDGDGDDDLLGTARVAGLVLWYENSGAPKTKPWKRHVIDTPDRPTHGQEVDMDQDGDTDLVMALSGDGLAVWYENDPATRDGSWPRHLISELSEAAFVVAGDLDGDGDLDGAATSQGDQPHLVWFENSGDPKGKWSTYVLKNTWKEAVQPVMADLDGNGHLDIAAQSIGADELRWWRNQGPASSTGSTD